jgi:hypothetical protein
MISPAMLTADLRKQLAALESDVRGQAEDPDIDGRLQSEWQSARAAARSSAAYESWKNGQITQIGVAWLLGTVFLRFCEDNGLISTPYLAGPKRRLALAEQRQLEFERDTQGASDRQWILRGLREINSSSTMAGLLDRRRSPIGLIEISDRAAGDLIAFWRTRKNGEVIHDFTDAEWGTGFLGDLYQNLSEGMRSADALLQTPAFVAEFMLDRALEPAITQFGLAGLRVIDPVCGSGTFLLGTFRRLLDHWRYRDSLAGPWATVSSALASIHGVDKNPIAVSITRFRIIIAAMKAGGARRLTDAPNLPLVIATGDSLLHGGGTRPGSGRSDLFSITEPYYRRAENIGDFAGVGLLDAGSYHVVVGNPPYATVKDVAESKAYRALYPYCVGAYALTIPFIGRSFDLAVRGADGQAGYVSLLTSNSFMKREFGRSLIEQFLPTVDLTDVIDASGVFIPGHGTPTVILCGRNQDPQPAPVRLIAGLRGEPEVPEDPACGHVWRSILGGFEHVPYDDGWTRGQSIDHSVLSSFPWNLADEATTQILQHMESGTPLGSRVTRIGYFANTGSDDLFTAPLASFLRTKAESKPLIPVITGSEVRDWTAVSETDGALLPGLEAEPPTRAMFPRHLQRLWPYRTVLRNRQNYSGRSYLEDHRPWYTWHHVTEDPNAHQWAIVFPWVSTHNHFAVLRGRAAPLNSAPVIRLPEAASDSDLIQLTALLNSSLVCFWLKQYSNSKGQPRTDQTGTGEPWTLFYEFTGTRLAELPLPPDRWSKDRWSVHAEQLDKLALELSSADPRSLLGPGSTVTGAELNAARTRWEKAHSQLVSLQEELDWEIYVRYGLASDSEELLAPDEAIPDLNPGERAFELLLARRLASGQSQSTWFERHNVTPTIDLPSRWPARYRQVVENRIKAIERRRDIGLVERPEFKRRWAWVPWEKRERDAVRNWLLDRCEDQALWYETGNDGKRRPRSMTIGTLAERLNNDQACVAMASRYWGGRADLAEIIYEITQNQYVPYLAALRYSDSGLRKRIRWEQTWDRQREEDELEPLPGIPVPPKYTSSDFLRPEYWRQRGKYDVPNERFISYPSPPVRRDITIGWAGWNHAERAHVLMDLVEDRKRSIRDGTESVVPLLAGLVELLPWLRQWHSTAEPPLWENSPAEEARAYLENEQAQRGLSSADLIAWRPPKPKRGRPPRTPVS